MVVDTGNGTAASRCSNFDLSWGQQRREDRLFYPQSNWYDEQGHFLGRGDLSIDDLHRIKKRLAGDQLFIVVGGAHFPQINAGTDGLDGLFERSPFVIAQHGQFFVTRLTQNLKNSFNAGLVFTVLTPEEARRTFASRSLSSECSALA